MTTPLDPGYAGVAELPPYRSLLLVDMKDYSGNAGRYQTELTRLIPQIMKSAFKRAGLAEIWACKTIYNTQLVMATRSGSRRSSCRSC